MVSIIVSGIGNLEVGSISIGFVRLYTEISTFPESRKYKLNRYKNNPLHIIITHHHTQPSISIKSNKQLIHHINPYPHPSKPHPNQSYPHHPHRHPATHDSAEP